jgi:hypothetical protein
MLRSEGIRNVTTQRAEPVFVIEWFLYFLRLMVRATVSTGGECAS